MRLLKSLGWLILLSWALPCMAQTDIHHCIDANGQALFSDQTCAANQATVFKPTEKPVVSPLETPDDGTAATSLSAPTEPTEPPPILCAATFKKLRRSVIEAFAHRNPNRMAGLMLWNGYGSETAVANIRSLTALMHQPLLDAEATSDDDNAADPVDGLKPPSTDPTDEAPADGNAIVLHLAGNDSSGDPRELRYAVVRRSGCLWLRPGD